MSIQLGKTEVTREDILEAIKEGVKEALLTMVKSGDGYTGDLIREPFLKAVEYGVRSAVSESFEWSLMHSR